MTDVTDHIEAVIRLTINDNRERIVHERKGGNNAIVVVNFKDAKFGLSIVDMQSTMISKTIRDFLGDTAQTDVAVCVTYPNGESRFVKRPLA